MSPVIENRVAELLAGDIRQVLRGRKVGLEKESLRVAADGGIAQTPHPTGLGSALTHPHITTDYSEALLELVTPPFSNFADTLAFLDDTHRFVYSQLDDELLWATSMPCIIEGDESIRIAEYGTSNAGMMKTTYRRGLGIRYGRMMQAIAGVHFNYSYPDEFWEIYQSVVDDKRERKEFVNDAYFGMIRNLLRLGWLVPYLFGASPSICASFLGTSAPNLRKWQEHSYYLPYATSLRVGDIGYQNSKSGEAGIQVDYNSLQGYVEGLGYAISTPYPDYEKLGVCKGGEWQQLNANILQIENEYYSSVRPKQIPQGEEKPTLALAKRGIAYIELRSLDVNVYEPLGMTEEHMRFLESFLLCSLLTPSPAFADDEMMEIKYNLNAVAERGRDPELKLRLAGKEILLRDWAHDILDNMAVGCELLDKEGDDSVYCSALQQQRAKIIDSDLTPSARVLTDMADNKEEFSQFALRMSQQHQQWFAEHALDPEKQARFEQAARDSLQRQHEIEASDEVPFASFLQNYFAQT